MTKPAFLNANNGAWMNRELYTIRSVDSCSEESIVSGEVENGGERLLRVQSDGESAVIPKVVGRSNDSLEEAEVFRYPIKGELDLGSMFPSLNRSADTDSAEHSSWSNTTDSLSEDSLDENKQQSVHPLQGSEGNPGSPLQVSPPARGDCTGSSSTVSVSSSSQSHSTDSKGSSSWSESTDSDRSTSHLSSTGSVSDSSGSQSTLYTSDASYTYLSDRMERMRKKRVAIENTPAGILALQRRPSVLTDSDSSSKNLRLTLDNVLYLSSFDQASTNCDLSTMDEPISQEVANGIFFRMAILPNVVPLDAQSEVSSICTRGQKNLTSENFHDLEAGMAAFPKTASSTVAEKITKIFQEYLEGRSKLELFFLLLICLSGIALIILLAVLVSQL
jgi:hypothetical protein